MSMGMSQHFTQAREAASRSANVYTETTGEFGPANDIAIATITVLSPDSELYDSVRRAVLDQYQVSMASDLEQAAEFAAAGKCAILITDQAMTAEASGRITDCLRKHEPAMVSIAVGNRGQDSVLLGLMSSAAVDRFMLKPLTPALVRIVIEAAEKEHHARKPRQKNQPRTDQSAAVTMQRTPAPMRRREQPRDRTEVTQPVRVLPSPPLSKPSPHAQQTEPAVEAMPEVVHTAPEVIARDERPEDMTVVVPSLEAELPAQNEQSAAEAHYGDARSSDAIAPQPRITAGPVEHIAGYAEPTHYMPSLGSSPFQESRVPRPPWLVSIAAVIAVAGLVWWIMLQRLPDIDPRQLIDSNLSAAQSAFQEQHYVEPSDRSAFHHYSTVLALDPTNEQAKSGVDRIADRFVQRADSLIGAGRFAEAVGALQDLRRVRPDHARVASLEIQLREKLERQFPQIRKPLALEPAREAAVAAALPSQSASQKAPAQVARSDARSSTVPVAEVERQTAPQSDISSDTTLRQQDAQGSESRVLTDARQAIERGDFDVARTLLSAALEMGAAPQELMAMNQSLSAAEQRLVAEQTPPPPAIEAAEPAPRAVAAPALAATQAVPAPPPDPVPLKIVQPQYPSEARLRGIEGWVDLSFAVSASGDVIEPRVEDSSMKHLFARPALTAVRQWKYQPRAAADPTQRTRARVQFRLRE